MKKRRGYFVFWLIFFAVLVSGESSCDRFLTRSVNFAANSSLSATPTPTSTPDDSGDDADMDDSQVVVTPTVSVSATPITSATPSSTSTSSATATATSTATVTPTTSAARSLRSSNADILEGTLQDLSKLTATKTIKAARSKGSHAKSSSRSATRAGKGKSEEGSLKAGDWRGKFYNKDAAEVPGQVEDSDGDGYSDLLEQDAGSDPRDSSSVPVSGTTSWRQRVLPIDADLDGVSDSEELALGLDPHSPDSDGDGVPDGAELLNGLDPKNPADVAAGIHDIDGDGLVDSYEQEIGSNMSSVDTDNDGLGDFDELVFGTDLNDNDSDSDGVLDGREVQMGMDPRISEVPQ